MNLTQIIDGSGFQSRIVKNKNWKPQDDVVVKRRTNRAGPHTSEVLVGKILAVGDTTATVSIQKPGGVNERRTVNLKDLTPVTDSIRRRSIQFNSQYRPRA